MFFSVIIPLYNKADVVERTLRSVLSQTYKDFELIIVDDGSTDNSLDVVQKFLDSYEWKSVGCEYHVVRQANSGVSAARNRGAQESRGHFLAMLDGDDVWLPFHLADLVAVYQAYPMARVMSTAEASVVGNKIKMPRYRKRKGVSRYNIFDFPYGDYPMCSDTIAIEREYFLGIGGYDTRFSYYEDRAFYYKLAEDIGDFYVNWRVSALYYHDALCSANKKRRKFSEFAFLEYTREMMSNNKASAKLKRCVAKTVDGFIRNEVVRWRWGAYDELRKVYPDIVAMTWKHRVSACWPLKKFFLFVAYSLDWVWVHFMIVCRRIIYW